MHVCDSSSSSATATRDMSSVMWKNACFCHHIQNFWVCSCFIIEVVAELAEITWLQNYGYYLLYSPKQYEVICVFQRPYAPSAQYSYNNWSPPAQSNESTNGYFLERSNSARKTLERACELCPEEVCYKDMPIHLIVTQYLNFWPIKFNICPL